MLAAQGFPLTLSLSKGERKSFFNGLLRHPTLSRLCACPQNRRKTKSTTSPCWAMHGGEAGERLPFVPAKLW
jgi:hypothetical protein